MSSRDRDQAENRNLDLKDLSSGLEERKDLSRPNEKYRGRKNETVQSKVNHSEAEVQESSNDEVMWPSTI